MNASGHLVIIGFDEIVSNKYMSCVREAFDRHDIDGYSIIDLESRRSDIVERLAPIELKPKNVVLLPESDDPELRDSAACGLGVKALLLLREQLGRLKVYIATEVRAHEPYLRCCVENRIESLVEKPVVAPIVDGRFAAHRISHVMDELLAAADPAVRHSVMTLSRYHSIYNDRLIASLRERIERWQAPLTSLHLRAAGGVWNLQQEYETRDDHPYKYGYGMLMHGAYHYVDLAAQTLLLNKALFPDRTFLLTVSSFGAHPTDQHLRTSAVINTRLGDTEPRWPQRPEPAPYFGETDVTAAFRLIDAETREVLTLGSLAFEQTTPSLRSWPVLRDDVYNKNGRVSSVDFEARLSTLYSVHLHCHDVPVGPDPDHVGARASLSTKANASLLPEEEYTSNEEFTGLFHSDSNRALMRCWLRGEETRSTLVAHRLPMRITEALARSMLATGRPVEIEAF